MGGTRPISRAACPSRSWPSAAARPCASGPLKPVGLTNPHEPEIKAHAVVQLRRENALGTLYNIVGFQTKMKYGAQAEVFARFPGWRTPLRPARRHPPQHVPERPRLLDRRCACKADPRLRFAGQITGVEGYVESAPWACSPGRFAAAERLGAPLPPAADTAIGALLHHITGGAEAETFQPMNVNFGLFPPLTEDIRKGRKGKRERARAYTDRAKISWDGWLGPRKAVA